MPRPGRDGKTSSKLQSTRGTAGRIDPNLEAFAHIGANYFQVYMYDEGFTVLGPDGETQQLITTEPGPTVRLVIARKFMLDLTNTTEEELHELREFFDRAFALAEPIVLARDKEARDVYERGDDTLARLHRVVPSVVVRSRAQRAYDQIVQLGSAAIAARGWKFINSLYGSRNPGNAVADSTSKDPESQDDRPKAD